MKIMKTAIALGLLASAQASAGCGEFAGLEQVLENSPFPISELTVAASNRFGYGINPVSAINPVKMAEVEKTLGRKVAASYLANSIRNSFANADKISAASLTAAEKIYENSYGLDITGKRYHYLNLRAIELAHPTDPNLYNLTSQYSVRLARAQVARKIIAGISAPNLNAGEVLSDFWTNHLNTSNSNGGSVAQYNGDYELALRKNLCSTFENMLLTSATQPAMINYLDNISNVRGAINENYGREVIELHTLGTGPVTFDAEGNKKIIYDQDEIYQSARVLSGWSFVRPTSPGVNKIEFKFLTAKHDWGAKIFPRLFGSAGRQVFGGGENEGKRFLRMLAAHPRTKLNICRKIGRHMLGYSLDPATVARCVAAYGTNGNLPKMYEAIVLDPLFWGRVNAGMKTPLELAISSLRALGMASHPEVVQTAAFTLTVENTLRKMGFEPFSYGPPTGQPVGAYWVTPAVIRNLMHLTYKNDKYVKRPYGSRTDAGLETYIQSLATPTQKFDVMMKDVLPVTYNTDGTRIRETMVELLKDGKVDKVLGQPAPGRTIATQVIGSSLFMKK